MLLKRRQGTINKLQLCQIKKGKVYINIKNRSKTNEKQRKGANNA